MGKPEQPGEATANFRGFLAKLLVGFGPANVVPERDCTSGALKDDPVALLPAAILRPVAVEIPRDVPSDVEGSDEA